VALQALVDSAIEFCEKSQVVQLTTSAVDAVSGTFNYMITLPADTAVSQVLRVWYGNCELNLIAQHNVNSPLAYNPMAGTTARQVGTPQLAIIIDPAEITLYPTPDVGMTAAVTVRVATKPTRSATTLADLLLEDWVEGVVAGAAYRLAASPSEAYSSDSNAVKYASMYRYNLGCARIEASKGRVRGNIAIQQCPFA
jgi:hypothetical protein